jgi:anti-anti-sigma factor
MAERLRLMNIRRGTCSIVAVSGNLDATSAIQLNAELSVTTGEIHLDCHDLTLADSPAVAAVLLEAHRRCEAHGHQLVIHGLSPAARRTFTALGLDRSLDIAGKPTLAPHGPVHA